MAASRSYLILLATLGAAVFVPALFGWTASVVQSESMAPLVSTGDVVLTSPLESGTPIPVGGVVTFRVDGRTVVHRIVALAPDNTIITAGDANAQNDPWSITRAGIDGQARLLVPFVGLPGTWLQRGDIAPLSIWVAITLAAVILAVPRSGVSGGGSWRRQRAASASLPPLRAIGGAVIAGLVTASLVALPVTPADAAFSGSARTLSSWKARNYSPITPGAIAGFGAIASASIQDTSSAGYRSSIAGDAATTPGASITGFRKQDIVATHLNDQAARNAMAAAQAARNALAERPVTRTLPADLTGTLVGGVYASTSGAFSLAGNLTLDANHDASARFVFRTATTLTMAQRAQVVLVNGAQAANVWWVVGSSATLGALTTGTPNTTAVGNYLVGTNAALRGVNLSGRVVAFTGSITLNGRIVPTN